MTKQNIKYFSTEKVMMKLIGSTTVELDVHDTKEVDITSSYVSVLSREGLISIIPREKVCEIILFPAKDELLVKTEGAFL